jgi:superfamily II DNA or RNA helicase
VAVLPLWPHQDDAVKAVVAEISDAGRCHVVMACGTGKTIVGAEVSAQVAGAGKVLVVVPTLELLAQTARAYAAHLGDGAGTIAAVCSESSATLEAAEIREEMDDLNAGVSTDPADVVAWLESAGRVTAFTTYQSLPAVTKAHQATGVSWDLIVIDEAHRSAGRAGRPWSMINEDSRIPARRRLYMTATPKIITVDDADAVSMDNQRIFGPEAYHLPFAEAIRLGLLADYRVAVIVVTDHEAARLASSARVLSAGGPGVPAGMLAAQVAVLKASARYGLRRVITYHHRVHRAQRFAQTLLSAADLLPDGEKPALIHAAAVDGEMSIAQRRDILRRLHHPGAHATFIANARVLAEGVDVPELDAVMFADARESATDVVQAVGRALRRGTREHKTATIIIPALLAEGESAEAALEGSAWDTVWSVVRALRAHDERLADWLDARRAARVLNHRGDGEDQPLPDWLTVHGMPVTGTFPRAMQLRLIETATTAWPEQLARLRAWHDEHGHLNIPHTAVTSDGFEVGQLAQSLRHRRKRGILTAPQVQALDVIGMIWDRQEDKWERGIDAAGAYHSEHGDLEVPAKYVSSSGYRLGSWIGDQRRRHKSGIMTATQFERLTALGMRWGTIPGAPLPVGELKDRYEAGENTYELAGAYGASAEKIRLALVAAGTTMRPGGTPRRRKT